MAHKFVRSEETLGDTFHGTASSDGGSRLGQDGRTSPRSRDRDAGFGFIQHGGSGGGSSCSDGYDQNRNVSHKSEECDAQSYEEEYKHDSFRGNPRTRAWFEDDEEDILMFDDGFESHQSQRYNLSEGPQSGCCDSNDTSGGSHSDDVEYRDLDTPGDCPAGEEEECWHRISVMHRGKKDQSWLICLLHKACPVPFQPVECRIVKRKMVFYVPNKAVADALASISRTLRTMQGHKIVICSAGPEIPESIRVLNKNTKAITFKGIENRFIYNPILPYRGFLACRNGHRFKGTGVVKRHETMMPGEQHRARVLVYMYTCTPPADGTYVVLQFQLSKEYFTACKGKVKALRAEKRRCKPKKAEDIKTTADPRVFLMKPICPGSSHYIFTSCWNSRVITMNWKFAYLKEEGTGATLEPQQFKLLRYSYEVGEEVVS